jgi:hypothetical protein
MKKTSPQSPPPKPRRLKERADGRPGFDWQLRAAHDSRACPWPTRLGLAALIGALWIDLPLDAVMIQIGQRRQQVQLCWPFPFLCWPAPSWPKAAWRGASWLLPACWWASCAAACRWSTSWPRTFFGAISGSSAWPTPPRIGSVLIPEMEKKGYPRPFATAVTVSGSVQAILIPPSHNAVMYSLAAGGTVSHRGAVHGRRAARSVDGPDPGHLVPVIRRTSAKTIPRARSFRCARR